jgi:hypothetical protein
LYKISLPVLSVGCRAFVLSLERQQGGLPFEGEKMTFKDDMLSDLDETFFDNEEFAVDITYNAGTIQGIFDDEFASAVEGEMGIESTVPQVQVKSADVSSATHGELMTINSVVYKIIGIQPDGTGMTLLLLSKD